MKNPVKQHRRATADKASSLRNNSVCFQLNLALLSAVLQLYLIGQLSPLIFTSTNYSSIIMYVVAPNIMSWQISDGSPVYLLDIQYSSTFSWIVTIVL